MATTVPKETAVLGRDGRLTLPQEIRQRLGTGTSSGQSLEFEVMIGEDGVIRLRPVENVDSAEDYLSLGHSVYEGLTVEAIDEVEAIALDRSHFRSQRYDV